MRNTVTGRTATVVVATALAVVSGCTAQETDSGPSTGAPTSSNTSSNTSQVGETVATKRFSGKTITAALDGYDEKLDMVEFYLVVSTGQARYERNPADPAQHRLPLAKDVTVLSASMICSAGISSTGITLDKEGKASQPCTRDQLVSALTENRNAIAEVEVNAGDEIAKVSEMYTP